MVNTPIHTEEDLQLVKLLSSSATVNEGFKLLIIRYQERLYWHIRRLVNNHEDANDVLQNVFIRVYKNIGKFKGTAKLYTWLYRIATNEAITLINKNKKNSTEDINHTEHSIANTLSADPFFDGNEAVLKLKTAVAALPEKQQLVFNMRYYDELPYKDISEILGTSVGGLKASYHIAVKKIEGLLTENE